MTEGEARADPGRVQGGSPGGGCVWLQGLVTQGLGDSAPGRDAGIRPCEPGRLWGRGQSSGEPQQVQAGEEMGEPCDCSSLLRSQILSLGWEPFLPLPGGWGEGLRDRRGSERGHAGDSA